MVTGFKYVSVMDCFLCHNQMTLILNNFDNKYYLCEDCQLVSSGFKYDCAVYDKLYANTYISYEQNEKTNKLMEIRKKWISEFMNTGSVLLDFGCGTGSFLRAIGCDYIGIGYDVNKSVISYARKTDCVHRYYNNKNSIIDLFDGISLFDVLEHFEDPLKEMKFLYKILNKEGYLFISTPNTELFDIHHIPKDWRHFKPDEHLHYFTQNSLLKLAQLSGFRIVKTDFRESEVRNTYKKNIRCVTMVK